MSPKVTILILNWNGRKWLEKFLPSVTKTTYKPLHILIADNGSTDDSLEFLKTHYPQIEILVFDKNHGFTGGNNLALPYIKTPYFALLNSDVEVSPGWLEPLVALMEKEPLLATVQPKIMSFYEKGKFEHAGAAGGYIDKFGYPFCRGRLFEKTETDLGQYDDAQEIFWATGACSLLRKSVVDKIGLFEPAFFAHMEEIDFCWRAKNHGYKVMYESKSVIFHVGGGTLSTGNPQKTFLNVHNSLAMIYKNLPKGKVFSKVLSRLLLDGVWSVQSLLKGDIQTIGAIIKAHWKFFGKLSFWHKRRQETYPTLPISMPKTGYYPKSIVWQFFARKNRTFSQLP
ncbi:glycosyltransferase family 2 protein [bacterium]|nr:glycosyltransferase family 2 protein [bacterium]